MGGGRYRVHWKDTTHQFCVGLGQKFVKLESTARFFYPASKLKGHWIELQSLTLYFLSHGTLRRHGGSRCCCGAKLLWFRFRFCRFWNPVQLIFVATEKKRDLEAKGRDFWNNSKSLFPQSNPIFWYSALPHPQVINTLLTRTTATTNAGREHIDNKGKG